MFLLRWGGVVGDASYLCRVHVDSIVGDDEAKKMEVGASPSIILPLELQVMLSYASQDFRESLYMVLPSGSVDKDVVEINEEPFTYRGNEDGVCHALECVVGIKQAKRHAGELEQLASCAECGLVGIKRL